MKYVKAQLKDLIETKETNIDVRQQEVKKLQGQLELDFEVLDELKAALELVKNAKT